MKLAIRADSLADEVLAFATQLGVTHVRILAGLLMEDGQRGCIQRDKLAAAVEQVNSHDLEIGGAVLPMGPGTQFRHACLGRPERDDEIRDVCRSIEMLGLAGVPVVEYVWSIHLGGSGKGFAPGYVTRGGAGIPHFDYDLVKAVSAPSPDEEVGAEEMWDRLTYFLQRVVPAAEEAEVRLACHPCDPPVARMMGEERILASIEGLDRLVETVPSPSNGLNFCQGTVAEMGVDAVAEIRRFGSRDKINMVHFRNIRGAVPVYEEVFIDEGDVDMAAAVRAYKEVGYQGMLMPDHTPVVVGDTPWGHRGRAFALGYIRALMHAADAAAGGEA